MKKRYCSHDCSHIEKYGLCNTTLSKRLETCKNNTSLLFSWGVSFSVFSMGHKSSIMKGLCKTIEKSLPPMRNEKYEKYKNNK